MWYNVCSKRSVLLLAINSVYLGNCLDIMQAIDDQSINMILADLPYGTTECSWDIVIPLDLLWNQYKRIIKQNGAILLFGSEPFSSHLRMSNIEMYKYDWIWVKSSPFGYLEAKNKPMKKHEIISVFSFGKSSNGCKNRITYNPQGLVRINKKIRNSTNNVQGERKSREIGSEFIQKNTNYPTSVLFFDSEKKEIHPTQKPVSLFEYLIKTYTNESELVLDNVAGSGTTGIACINTNRNFILIEKDERYFDIINERISNHKLQLKMF